MDENTNVIICCYSEYLGTVYKGICASIEEYNAKIIRFNELLIDINLICDVKVAIKIDL